HFIVDAVFKLDELDDFMNAVRRNAWNHASIMNEILIAGQKLVQFRVFYNGANMANRLFKVAANAFAIDPYLALCDRHQADHHTDRGRFACAVGAEESVYFTARHVEGKVI